MRKARFLEQRRPEWETFETLLEKAENRRSSKLTATEVSEFSRLFRAVCYDLATVRSRDWGHDIEHYLNDLVARGHNNFYRSPPGKPREVLRFLAAGFPKLLRANITYFWVSLAFFTVPGIIAATLVGNDPSLAGRVLPGTQLVAMEQMYAETREEGTGSGMEAMMTGFYVQHNIGIAFKCFATGIFFGVGTVYVLIYNSIALGTISAFLVAKGHSERFLSFVVSHGSFELTAIVVSGAAGLVIGHAVIAPGQYSRGEALLRRGRVGVKLALGAGAMLAVAAVIEAFWSPLGIPPVFKYVVGGLLWILVFFYLTFSGRSA